MDVGCLWVYKTASQNESWEGFMGKMSYKKVAEANARLAESAIRVMQKDPDAFRVTKTEEATDRLAPHCEMCGTTKSYLEPAYDPDWKRRTLCRECRIGSADILHNRTTFPQLNSEDWEEIYYALDYKLTSPAVTGDRKWVAHLKAILETIGPDGKNMVEE